MSRFGQALLQADVELDRGARKATDKLLTAFRDELANRVLHRHKFTVEQMHGLAELCVNGTRWWETRLHRNPSRFPVTTLLKDIADTIEKCDNAVLRHLYGITL